MIKAIIFDYGGVLSMNSSLRDFGLGYAPRFGKDPEAFSKVIIENWNLAKVDKISSKLFWIRLAKFIGNDATSLRKDFIDFFGYREDTLKLAKKLKNKGYILGLLSNHIEDLLEEIIEDRKLKQTFDVIVTSYKSKIAKPDITIFREVVEKMGVKPEDCVYIDDMDKNIPPAKMLGMKTILFTDIENLKKVMIDFLS